MPEDVEGDPPAGVGGAPFCRIPCMAVYTLGGHRAVCTQLYAYSLGTSLQEW